MSTETLRRAAALMRERAEVARAGRWVADGPDILAQWEHEARYIGVCDALPSPDGNVLNADHIASWHPAVALAVAPLLLALAERADEIADSIGSERVAASVIDSTLTGFTEAVEFARAYLGEER